MGQQQHPMHLPNDWQVPQGMCDRLGTAWIGRQRAIIDETLPPTIHSPLLLVLQEVPGSTQNGRELFLWRDLDGRWRRYFQGEQYNSKADGIATLHEQLAHYEMALQSLRDNYAQARRAATYLAILDAAAPQRHAADHLCRALDEARTLMREQRTQHDGAIIAARDRAYQVACAFDLLYTDAENALHYRQVRATETTNRLLFPLYPLLLIAIIFQTGLLQQLQDRLPAIAPQMLTFAGLIIALLVGTVWYWVVRGSQQERSRRAAGRQQKQRSNHIEPSQLQTTSSPQRANPLLRPVSSSSVALEKNMQQYGLQVDKE